MLCEGRPTRADMSDDLCRKGPGARRQSGKERRRAGEEPSMDGAEAKKRAEAGRVRRPGRRWVKTAGGPALFVAVMGVILVTVLGWGLHRGSLTPQWGKTLARELTQGLAVPVSVDAVGLGVNRLVLHGVETGGAVPVEAERVVVGLSWVDVWRPGGGLLEGVRWIEVDGLRAELPP